MPDLNTSLHLDMLESFRRRNSALSRLVRAVKTALWSKDIYGLQWGDPEVVEPLRFIRNQYVLPYVDPQHTALEIGPGGGRWTRYLLGFKRLYAVDYHPELLDELRKNFNEPNMVFIKNNGTDFPGVEPGSIDYLFSFGTFVHLDLDVIDAYLKSMKGIVKPGANIVIQYSDKTKIMAQMNPGFSNNTPERMRQMIVSAEYRILEEDLTTMWHSSLVRFTV